MFLSRQLLYHIFLNLIDGPKTSSLSNVILVLVKARSCRVPNLGCRGFESPGWFGDSPINSPRDMMHEWVCCRDEAIAFWIIWIVSAEECSSLTQNLMHIRCSTGSVILNAIATQYTCSLNVIYCPTDWYGEVVIVHTCAFQSTLLGCQVTSMSRKPFSLY